MKKFILFLLVIGAVVAAGVAARPRWKEWMEERNKPTFETVKVERGEIEWFVQTIGTIKPVLEVHIGSFVSGPIVELNAEFNEKVEEGKLLAKVDPRIYKAAVERDTAALMRAKADVERVQARLQQAINDLKRAKQLQKINEGYISQSEMDQLCFSKMAQEAELKVAKLQIKQAQANLDNSELNLQYTEITAPDAGIIIDRKIQPGQTLAAQFQTPELFVLAPEMDERMWVHASVVEADIGHVIRAKNEEREVQFYVDAYEDELFTGKIMQVRQNPITDQNVVSYPVIVETTNEDLKLLPGMTANLSFQVDKRTNVLKIPSEAIRFLPEDKKHVAEADHDIVDGREEDELAAQSGEGSAQQRIEATKRRRRRHVWVQDGDKLRAVKIEFGINDGRYYELVEGDLEEGQELVYAIKAKGS